VFVKADRRRGKSAILEASTQENEGVLIFLPGEDVAISNRPGGEKLVRTAFFESRTNKEGFGSGGQDEGPETFTAVKVQVRKVDRGAGRVGEDDGVNFIPHHQFASVLDAGLTLGGGEWASLARENGEGLDGGRR